MKDSSEQRMIGTETLDSVKHDADLVIVTGECSMAFRIPLTTAAGGWNASIVPGADQAIETTAVTILFVDIPEERQDLLQKFHPDNWPVWSVRNGSGEEYATSLQMRVSLSLLPATTWAISFLQTRMG